MAESTPTWLNPVKTYFTRGDVSCMKNNGPLFDLSNYQEVKDNADQIYGITSSQQMPPGRPWSQEKLDTFFRWMQAGCPFGTTVEAAALVAAEPQRVRRDFTALVQNYPEEFALFKKAFAGIMALPPENPNSYFALASIHGLPGASLCWHHFFGFVPWHRQYTMAIENALRTIEGCENVTMPYWDQYATKGIPPKELYEPPFDKYVYQQAVGDKGPNTNNPYTFRATLDQMINDLAENREKYIVPPLAIAMSAVMYEDFADYRGDGIQVEHAHDAMHATLGGVKPGADDPITINPFTGKNELGDMAAVEYTAFDPIFWFTHCDYDRLLWEWQKQKNALDIKGLANTFRKKDHEFVYLDGPMHPWSKKFGWSTDVTFRQLIDGAGVVYDKGSFSDALLLPAPRHFLGVSRPVATVVPGCEVVIRNVDRTKISGSFTIRLFKENPDQSKELLGVKFFFQRMEPKLCESCQEYKLMNFGFRLSETPSSFSFDFIDNRGNEVPARRLGNPVLAVHSIVQ